MRRISHLFYFLKSLLAKLAIHGGNRTQSQKNDCLERKKKCIIGNPFGVWFKAKFILLGQSVAAAAEKKELRLFQHSLQLGRPAKLRFPISPPVEKISASVYSGS